MAEVVLLYRLSCPNVHEARNTLTQAFSTAGIPASWREVDLDAADTPPMWRQFGSPTVLVDGVDVGGDALAHGATCRIYESGGRLTRSPPVETIVTRLLATTLVSSR